MSFNWYFDLGLRAMSAAQLGIQIAGDNISNVSTPGYVRRRVELSPGFPVPVQRGLLDSGVEVTGVQRMEDRFLQAQLEREEGSLGESDERLRGLQDIESVFGDLESSGLAYSLEAFSSAFTQLATQPENSATRRAAISAADDLAQSLRSAYGQLQDQRGTENQSIEVSVTKINDLASQLARLNLRIVEAETGGTVAAPLRDERAQVVEQLVELTGGTAATAPRGTISFSLPGGPTLVTGEDALSVALPLRVTHDANGMVRIASGGNGADVTDRIRSGRLGAMLQIRDEAIPARTADLDALAADIAARANALTAGATDLRGNAGGPLFVADPPSGTITAANIAVAQNILSDPSLLAVSATGAPGDGSVAQDIAALTKQASAALGGKTPSEFLSDGLSRLGTDIARADVSRSVSQDLVDSLKAKRDTVSGVSLDEEAVELLRSQQLYQAGAQFLQAVNSMTQIAIELVKG